jgi:dihydrofolate reductase
VARSSVADRPRISLIAALDRNRAIGKDGGIPWRLPDDLKRFRRVTTGHPVVMGRKTYEAIGRPLPDRINVVITRQPAYPASGCTVVASLDAALDVARSAPGGADIIFIIGGGEIYTAALPIADELDLTYVDTAVEGAQAFFPPIPEADWHETRREHHPADEKHAFPFDYVTLERRKPR